MVAANIVDNTLHPILRPVARDKGAMRDPLCPKIEVNGRVSSRSAAAIGAGTWRLLMLRATDAGLTESQALARHSWATQAASFPIGRFVYNAS